MTNAPRKTAPSKKTWRDLTVKQATAAFDRAAQAMVKACGVTYPQAVEWLVKNTPGGRRLEALKRGKTDGTP